MRVRDNATNLVHIEADTWLFYCQSAYNDEHRWVDYKIVPYSTVVTCLVCLSIGIQRGPAYW